MRLIRHANAGDAGPRIRPVDEYRDEYFASVLSETARELSTCIYTGDEARQHFGQPVCVRHGHNAPHRLGSRLKQQAFTIDALKHRPSHGVNFVPVAESDGHLLRARRCKPNVSCRKPLVHGSDDSSQVIAIRRY